MSSFISLCSPRITDLVSILELASYLKKLRARCILLLLLKVISEQKLNHHPSEQKELVISARYQGGPFATLARRGRLGNLDWNDTV